MKTSLKDIEFLTTAEVAEKLKLHPQVVLRKLNAGELPGYKLGKDWRIATNELWDWLQRHANSPKPSNRETTLRNFLKDDQLVRIPTQRKKRVYVLEHVLQQFESNRVYSETEVNDILRTFYADVCTLRRELIGERMMVRSDGRYRRASSYKVSADD